MLFERDLWVNLNFVSLNRLVVDFVSCPSTCIITVQFLCFSVVTVGEQPTSH